jgi:rhodanese-related sulfurtransferase
VAAAEYTGAVMARGTVGALVDAAAGHRAGDAAVSVLDNCTDTNRHPVADRSLRALVSPHAEGLIHSYPLSLRMDGEISTDEVASLLEAERAPRIVDIRSPAAFARGHIPGSENVPFGQLPEMVESLAGADHIVTVCPHGKASVQAARLITSFEGTADARVESMAGGLEDWDGPLEADGETADSPDAPF